MEGSVRKKCSNCDPHTYQDNKYGNKIRIMNRSQDGSNVKCTVCGKQHSTR